MGYKWLSTFEEYEVDGGDKRSWRQELQRRLPAIPLPRAGKPEIPSFLVEYATAGTQRHMEEHDKA